jgi:hypothetical protein
MGLGRLLRRRASSKFVGRMPTVVIVKVPLAGFFANRPIAAVIILKQLPLKLAGHARAGVAALGL